MRAIKTAFTPAQTLASQTLRAYVLAVQQSRLPRLQSPDHNNRGLHRSRRSPVPFCAWTVLW